jgi:hypothetical protein
MKPLSLLFASMIFFAVSPVTAQVLYSPYAAYPCYPYVYCIPHHCSTVFEGYARGQAELMRAQGENSLLYSQAMVNREEAYKRYLDNKQTYLANLWENKAKNKKERFGEGPSKKSPYSAASNVRVNPKVEITLIDQHTGKINWPTALQDSSFKGYRQAVEQILAKYSNSANVSAADQARLINTKQAMEETLKGNIRKYSTQDYLLARQFLNILPSIFAPELKS